VVTEGARGRGAVRAEPRRSLGEASGAPSAVRIDLHVHTGRYSQCAELVDPYLMAEWATRAGIDGVVVTDHDVLWAEEEMLHLRCTCPGVRFYRGMECSLEHVVVIGLDDAGMLQRGASLSEVADYARPRGAVVILAHPYRDADPLTLPLDLVDAVEVGSTSFTAEEAKAACRLAVRLGKPQVACSDAHSLSRIGYGCTEFARLPGDEGELAEMIRRGWGRPILPEAFPP